MQDMDEASFAKQVRGYRARLDTGSAAAEGARGGSRDGAAHRWGMAAAPSADCELWGRFGPMPLCAQLPADFTTPMLSCDRHM